METSEQINELATALSAAQGEFVGLIKENSVNMELKNGRKIQYDYLDLGSIVEQVKNILSKNGLSVTQPIGTVNGAPALFTFLLHKSGQFMKTFVMLNYDKTDYNGNVVPMTEQEKGSVVTFNSRYNYVGILRIPLKNEDTDANDLRKDLKNNDEPEKKKFEKSPDKPKTPPETDFTKYKMKLKTKNKENDGKSLAEIGTETVLNIYNFLEKKDLKKLNHDEAEFVFCSYRYLQSVGVFPPDIDETEKIPT